jgi:hypothetical protein
LETEPRSDNASLPTLLSLSKLDFLTGVKYRDENTEALRDDY